MDKGGKVTSLIEDLIKEFSGFPIDKINWENLDLALQNTQPQHPRVLRRCMIQSRRPELGIECLCLLSVI